MRCADTSGMKPSLWVFTMGISLAAIACGGQATQASQPAVASAPPPAAAPAQAAPTPRPISTEILVARYIAPSEQAKLDAEKNHSSGAMVAAAVPDQKPAPSKRSKKKR